MCIRDARYRSCFDRPPSLFIVPITHHSVSGAGFTTSTRTPIINYTVNQFLPVSIINMPTWDLDDNEDYYTSQLRHYGFRKALPPVYPDEPTKAPLAVSTTTLIEGTGMPVPKPAAPAPLKSILKPQAPPTAWTDLCQALPVPEPVVEAAPVETTTPTISPKTSKFNEEGMSAKNTVPARKPVGTVNPKQAGIPPVLRDAEGYFPGMNRVDHQGQVDTVPSSSNPQPSRPRARRSDSSSSIASIKSIKNLVRKVSQDFKEHVEIVKMDRSERLEFRRSKVAGLTGSPSTLTLNRDSFNGLREQPATPTKARPGSLRTGEKLALGVSMLTDGIKNRGRSATNDSDMSFGDTAPADTMNACSSCGEPTWDHLTHGVCKDCYEMELRMAGEKTKGK